MGWAVGARRSYLDARFTLAGALGLEANTVPYAFDDVTGRVDVELGSDVRLEASAFRQDDRVCGDIPNVAYSNDGDWGTFVARTSLVARLGGTVTHTTLGISGFGASVGVANGEGSHAPVHPTTENHYRTLAWESRVDGAQDPDRTWSAGFRATHEVHDYSGPGIDLASLLSPDELARRGVGDLTPILVGLQRSHLLETEGMTRVSLWGERRHRLWDRIDVEGGLRVETGDVVLGTRVRLAPRLRLRLRRPGSPFSITLGYGRAYQYLQSVARTDILRSGIRASEVFVQAGSTTPALRSGVVTLGGDVWQGSTWLLGGTTWMRATSGVLLPNPTPGIITGARQSVPATGMAYGAELSARKLVGRVRGFVNYSVSRSRNHTRALSFDAAEDRRHLANIAAVADVSGSWLVGATLRAETGAPYTRITVIGSDCTPGLGCDGELPVLVGAPGRQRAPAYLGLDLMSEWTHTFGRWSVSVYGQLRNVLNRRNPVTYHSSCVCTGGDAANGEGLQDRFDRGLPRFPVIGLRARF